MTLEISAARFAPMRRLLLEEDEDYLAALGFRREASHIRKQHRKLFFRFVNMLARDFSTVHTARKAALAHNWDFEVLLRERFTASYYLWLMRTAGFMHLLHVPQAARMAQRNFDRFQSLVCIPAGMPGRVPV